MSALRLTSSLLAAAALVGPATPAAAQHAAVPGAARPAAATPAARTVATYRFVGWRAAELPLEITVADSGGTLVATARTAGARRATPLLVTLVESDLVFQSETPAGVLTLRLARQNEPDAAAPLEGEWWLGGEHGTLRGSTQWRQVASTGR